MIDELKDMLAVIRGSRPEHSQARAGICESVTIASYLSIGKEIAKWYSSPSAHGTNPASAASGFKPVTVASDAKGNVDMDAQVPHESDLAAFRSHPPHGILAEIKRCADCSRRGQVYGWRT